MSEIRKLRSETRLPIMECKRVLLAACLVFGACAADFPYQYISLEESMSVMEYGQSKLVESGNPKLLDHEAMPIRYELKTSEYTVVAQTDLESHEPSVIFSVHARTSERVSLDANGPTCMMFSDNGSDPEQAGYSADSIRLVWVERPAIEFCLDRRLPQKEGMIITIQVFGDAGIIGQHELEFAIKNNGVKRWYDGL